MRKVVLLMHVSLDGFVAGPNGELEWIVAEGEVHDHVQRRIDGVDTAIYGRVTYEMMEGYWPGVPENPESSPEELKHASWYLNAKKIVFSRTLGSVERPNTLVIKDNIREEITALKDQPGGDIMIFGSPSIAQEFMRLGLIDEYRIQLNPMVIGEGIPMYKGLTNPFGLKFVDATTFDSGVIALHYERR
jgi:dihydrofolate reductase